MATKINRLSAVKAAAIKTPGLHADGGGLYLQVTATSSRSWIFRFKFGTRTRDMGLGSLDTISLSQARTSAGDYRRLLSQGIDPIEARRAKEATERLAAAQSITFDQCRDKFIEAHKPAWRNEKHQKQWTSTLQTYVTPVFGSLPIQRVDVAAIMNVLDPLWATKPETAGRIRGRVERILDWAKARGLREEENPARWRGHLDALLPARSKVRHVQHHTALPYIELPDFMAALAAQKGAAARALEKWAGRDFSITA
jgi:hypothetical protein